MAELLRINEVMDRIHDPHMMSRHLPDIKRLIKLSYRFLYDGPEYFDLYMMGLYDEAQIVLVSGDEASLQAMADRLHKVLTNPFPPGSSFESPPVIDVCITLGQLYDKLKQPELAVETGKMLFHCIESSGCRPHG